MVLYRGYTVDATPTAIPDLRSFFFANFCFALIEFLRISEILNATYREREYFVSDKFPFSVNVYERYAANLLYRTLESLPAVVRHWYAGLPNAASQIVNKYVRCYVSKLLIEAELNKVKMANQSHLKADKLLKVRCRYSSY
ncbi:hypothetical protein Y032_0037g3383 [Ancylostoma ceylanicum]|uniref:E3 ubiquitin-protein ligase listerin n=1 Tax=Ancylostoma ceylanicum TaxID=53326 RepID=A0A016UJW9_9BILA|nr:hypothetical protein Y032_0037g3383 [Ancylostoma ceylanicum]